MVFWYDSPQKSLISPELSEMLRIYSYSEGENNFLMVDGRQNDARRFCRREAVRSLCCIYAMDGVAVLKESDTADFRLEYNDAHDDIRKRESALLCAVAYADLLGIKPFHSTEYRVEVDGLVFDAEILSHMGECKVVHTLQNDITGSAICEGEIE